MAEEVDTRPVHSNFDTTLGYVHFNISSAALSQEIIDFIVAANRRRKGDPGRKNEYVHALKGLIVLQYYPLLVHEWAHAIQAITHPALYVRCLREFSAMVRVISDLGGASQQLSLPLQIPEAWAAAINTPIQRHRISISDQGDPVVEEPGPGRSRSNDLSETDLLEGSASIFQFKAEIGGEGTARLYRRWLEEEEERYPRTFEFLLESLTADDAYAALPALVMAANMTNRPVHGFISLLATTLAGAGPGMPSEVGAEAYWRFLQDTVKRDFPRGDPAPHQAPSEEGSHVRMDRDEMLKLTVDWQAHPLTSLVELAWRKRANVRRLQRAILSPATAFSRRRRDAEDWLEPYQPPVMAYRLIDDKLAITDTPLEISQTVLAKNASMGETGLKEHVLELMRLRAFAFGVATPFLRESPHNCPHRKCAFHRHDLCRKWINIPAEFNECEFPRWLEVRVKHRLDTDSGVLVPVHDERTQGDG